jgi:hypothetical protein
MTEAFEGKEGHSTADVGDVREAAAGLEKGVV